MKILISNFVRKFYVMAHTLLVPLTFRNISKFLFPTLFNKPFSVLPFSKASLSHIVFSYSIHGKESFSLFFFLRNIQTLDYEIQCLNPVDLLIFFPSIICFLSFFFRCESDFLISFFELVFFLFS